MKKFPIALAIKKKAFAIYAPSKFVKALWLLSKMKVLAPFAPVAALVAAPAAIVVGAALNIKRLAVSAI